MLVLGKVLVLVVGDRAELRVVTPRPSVRPGTDGFQRHAFFDGIGGVEFVIGLT